MLAKLPLSASLDWLMVFAVGAECCRVQYGFEVGASPEGKMTPWTTSSQVKVKCSMCGSLALFVYSYWSCFLCWRISLHWLRLYKVFNFQNKFLLIQLIKQQVFCLQERVLVFPQWQAFCTQSTTIHFAFWSCRVSYLLTMASARLSGFLLVDSTKNVQNFIHIWKIPKPKCISGNSE